MRDNLKPCPFCSEKKDLHLYIAMGAMARIECPKCLCACYLEQWNNRPQEEALKQAIDILMKGISSATDENITHKFRNARLKQATLDARKILGIDINNK